MPELSRFYGIVIRTYVEAGAQRQRPHVHAHFGDTSAVYAIDPVAIVAGFLPRRQHRLVEAWAELHQTELAHEIHRVVGFEFEDGYVLRVRFEDDSVQRIDLEPVLEGEIYGPLRDLELFRAVRVDPEAHTLVWPNGADFDPATLHDWPRHAAAFAERARSWRTQTNG